MREIVELKWDNKLRIMRSISLKDKREYYEAVFKHPNGYCRTESFIRKSDLQNPLPSRQWGCLDNTLYINATVYDRDPEPWIKLVKEWRERNDLRKWLRKE